MVALLLGTRHLAVHNGPAEVIRAARRLLIFSSMVTLALNVAEPLIAGHYGRAAFDAVGPLLLIGWAEVAPNLLQAMQTIEAGASRSGTPTALIPPGTVEQDRPAPPVHRPDRLVKRPAEMAIKGGGKEAREQDLLHRARAEDVLHWQLHQRPISAETLRKHLRVGAGTARRLVAQLRSDTHSALHSRAPQPAAP